MLNVIHNIQLGVFCYKRNKTTGLYSMGIISQSCYQKKIQRGYITVNDDGDVDRCTLTLWRTGELAT